MKFIWGYEKRGVKGVDAETEGTERDTHTQRQRHRERQRHRREEACPVHVGKGGRG